MPRTQIAKTFVGQPHLGETTMHRLSLRYVAGSLVTSAALALIPAAGHAAFNSYGNEGTWRAAVVTFNFEDFESYAVGTQFTSLPGLGVSFAELIGGGYPNIYQHFQNTTPYGSKHLANFPNGINAINRYAAIILMPQFGVQLTALGFFNGDGQADTMIATAYDSNDNALGSVGAFKGAFAGFVSSTPVAKVVFGGNTGDGWNHIDGLQTHTAAVPEVSTFWMLALGVVALGAKRRSTPAGLKDA